MLPRPAAALPLEYQSIVPSLVVRRITAGIVLCEARERGNFTWINIAWIPGGLLFAQFGSVISPSPLMGLGFWLHPLGSAMSGILAARAVRFLSTRGKDERLEWHFWLALLLRVVWVPVPFRATFFYWFESY
jgi:hypothetical protein